MGSATRIWRIWIVWIVLVALATGMAVRAAGEWTAPLRLSPGDADAERACVAVDTDGRVHVVWSESGEVWHRVNAGQGWSAAEFVGTGIAPGLAAGASGRVYLALADRIDEVDDIYCLVWSAAEGWGVATNVSESEGGAYSPCIATAPDGSVGIVWNELAGSTPRIHMARSTDGQAWSAAPVPHGNGSRPTLAFVSADEWCVAWQDPLEPGAALDIFVTRYRHGAWGLPEDISGTGTVASLWPSLAASQGRVWLAWQEGATGSGGICYATNEGASWSLPQRISGEGDALGPQWAIDAQQRVHLAWTTATSVRAMSWTAAAGWGPREDVAVGQQEPDGVCIAAGTSAHVTWIASPAERLGAYYSRRPLSAPPAGSYRAYLPIVLR